MFSEEEYHLILMALGLAKIKSEDPVQNLKYCYLYDKFMMLRDELCLQEPPQ